MKGCIVKDGSKVDTLSWIMYHHVLARTASSCTYQAQIFEGPRTDIKRRLREGVKPTTKTDAAARTHDIQYHNIGAKLARGLITREQAVAQIKASDNRLLKSAVKAKMSLNPVEHAHSTAAIAGIMGKKGLQAVGALNELAFTGNDPEELEGGRKKKKRDPIGGLKKRFKKMGL